MKKRIRRVALIIVSFLVIILSFLNPARAEPLPLSIAQSQIGLGEIGGNNKGIYVRQYLAGQEGLPWCAGFISWVLNKAEVTDFPYFLRVLDYYKLAKHKKLLTNKPRPGDLILFSRNGGGHIGIVERVQGDVITTIEGNVGKYPSKVKRRTYSHKPKNLLGYVRIKR